MGKKHIQGAKMIKSMEFHREILSRITFRDLVCGGRMQFLSRSLSDDEPETYKDQCMCLDDLVLLKKAARGP